MKKISVFFAAIVLMLTLSSWSIKNLLGGSSSTTTTTTEQTTTSAAQTSGQNAGKALLALYQGYKTAGTIDMKDVTTYANLALLMTNVSGLKENYKNTEYLADYGKGLIAGGTGIVTDSNVSSVTSALTDIANTSETVSNETVSSITNLMSLFSASAE